MKAVLGKNVKIECKSFEIGDYSYIGDNTTIRGNHVKIGEHFYCSGGLRVGGGGHSGPNANLTIGDRCTMHNNFINVCEPVVIGNDVGLSEKVSIITHGYWQSVLEGYPRKFAGVTIGNGVIVGYRSIILPDVVIADDCVIGAGSVVTKSMLQKGIYGGNPAKFIRKIKKPTGEEAHHFAYNIFMQYIDLAKYHSLDGSHVGFDFPMVYLDKFQVNLITFEYSGEETEVTDHFRDYMRKWGIRIYTKRPFS